jgi:hypothetical protein
VRLPRGAPASRASLEWPLELEHQVVAAVDAVLADGGEQVGHRATLGDLRLRVEVEPRPEHEGPLRGPRVREAEVVVVRTPVADDDEVHVEGAGRVAHLAALAVEGVLDGQRTVQQAGRGECGVGHHDGVEEQVRPVRGVDRLGLVDRRDARDPHVRGVGQRAHRPLEVVHPLAEVGPQRDHGPADRAHLARQRVGVDDVRVGGLGHGWPSWVFARVIVSATSENVASMGASGLWTVTRTH